MKSISGHERILLFFFFCIAWLILLFVLLSSWPSTLRILASFKWSAEPSASVSVQRTLSATHSGAIGATSGQCLALLWSGTRSLYFLLTSWHVCPGSPPRACGLGVTLPADSRVFTTDLHSSPCSPLRVFAQRRIKSFFIWMIWS